LSNWRGGREVAQLEHQLAQSDIESPMQKSKAAAASLKDEENARVVEHQRYAAYLIPALNWIGRRSN